MASQKQIAANRCNAQKSTGPGSPEGKQKSKLNALKHGATAELVCIPGEDPQAFENWRQDLVAWHQPEGPEECNLVDRIAILQLRLQRIPRAEAALIASGYWWTERSIHIATARSIERSLENYDNWDEEPEPKDASPSNEDQELYDQAVMALEKAEAASETEAAKIGKALTDSTKTLTLLNRYEVTLERALLRTRAELERLQDRRGRLSTKGVLIPGAVQSESERKVIELAAERIKSEIV